MKLLEIGSAYDTALVHIIKKHSKYQKIQQNFEENYYFDDDTDETALGDVVIFRPRLNNNLKFVVLGGNFNTKILSLYSSQKIVSLNKKMRTWTLNNKPKIGLTKDFFVLQEQKENHTEYSLVQRCIFYNRKNFAEKIFEIYNIEMTPSAYITVMTNCSCCEESKIPKGIIYHSKEIFEKKWVKKIKYSEII